MAIIRDLSAKLLATNRTRDEILKAYPYLEPADIDQSLAYAAWRLEEREHEVAVYYACKQIRCLRVAQLTKDKLL